MAEPNKSRIRALGRVVGRPAEVALIQKISRSCQVHNVAVERGIGDDCAVLRPSAQSDLVVTTDLFLEGRHFRRDWHSPASAGHRCLARGLSDLAAMGAQPLAAFLSLALPRSFQVRWLDGFLRGFNDLAERFGVELAGGDTAEAPGGLALADIVLVGSVPRGRALLRTGARVGDGIYVSGTLGGSAVELRSLAAGARCPPRRRGTAQHPQSFPEPRLALGQHLLQKRLATAAMDLSDGLSTDLAHLCRCSGVGAKLDSATLPLAHGASIADALHGGEDYELLFTSPRPLAASVAGVNISRIGTITAAKAVILDGKRLQAGGWEHFRS